jgi:hypothetical protein
VTRMSASLSGSELGIMPHLRGPGYEWLCLWRRRRSRCAGGCGNCVPLFLASWMYSGCFHVKRNGYLGDTSGKPTGGGERAQQLGCKRVIIHVPISSFMDSCRRQRRLLVPGPMTPAQPQKSHYASYAIVLFEPCSFCAYILSLSKLNRSALPCLFTMPSL